MNSLADAVYRLVVGFRIPTTSLSHLEQAVLTELHEILLQPNVELEVLLAMEAIPEWTVLPNVLGVETSPA